MSLERITEQMRARIGSSAGLGKSVKFDFGDDGVVHVDDTVSPVAIDNRDVPVDCTVRVAMADFIDLATGKQNPQMAYMTGKLKIDGDMSVAFQLGSLLG